MIYFKHSYLTLLRTICAHRHLGPSIVAMGGVPILLTIEWQTGGDSWTIL